MHHINDMIIMFWQTDRCVMLGSNQIVVAEIKLPNAIKHNVTITRRPSGGGTISLIKDLY